MRLLKPDWLRLSLAASAVPGPTPPHRYEVEVVEGPSPLRLRFAGGPEGFRFLDDAGPVDATIRGAPEHLLGLLAGFLSPDAARDAGAAIEGDAAVLAALTTFFEFRPPSPGRAQPPTPMQGANP